MISQQLWSMHHTNILQQRRNHTLDRNDNAATAFEHDKIGRAARHIIPHKHFRISILFPSQVDATGVTV